MKDVYPRLAEHLKDLIMGYPFSEALLDLLRGMFEPAEAEVALAIPNDLAPLEVAAAGMIARRAGRPESEVAETLRRMADKNVIFSAPAPSGGPGYALLQAFLWHGRRDERTREMARLIIKYFTVPVTREVYGGAATKTYKYSPSGLAVDVPMQGVLPHERIGAIVEAADRIALAHCPCRVSALVLGRTDCRHSLEVCVKYDEMADFVIDRGLARAISRDEAMHVMRECEKEGLVHMVDNAQGQIKHTCNCCGCYCWNVGIIKRRKIPRDVLMAVYFIRRTEDEACIGCGACAEICPVQAVSMVEDRAVVDLEWCIGCGVCAVRCPSGAISIERRTQSQPPETVGRLHQRIRMDRGRV
ncbi:MAG: 4Fe-4S binding protein [Proteobacteria bacterium]|nr:4Fe-4S binding protein [Pseudomonadota bacterium]